MICSFCGRPESACSREGLALSPIRNCVVICLYCVRRLHHRLDPEWAPADPVPLRAAEGGRDHG